MATGIQYLRDAHRNGNLIPVVGAGFASATANLPSWPSLLSAGVSYVNDQLHRPVPPSQVKALESLADSGDLPEAFSYLQRVLAHEDESHYDSVDYQGFFNDVFHDVEVKSVSLPSALRAIRARVVLTTNYDLLLEELKITPGSQSTTWLNPAAIRSMLRSGSGVVHLHGRYDIPRSIILSTADYQRLVTDDDATAVAQAAFHSGILLFIGSSVSGVGDPHMSKILSEFSRMTGRTGGEEAPHVALVKGRPPGVEIARLRKLGIEALSFGNDYCDLPPFLNKLVESEKIVVRSRAVRSLIRSIGDEKSKTAALLHIADFIRQETFYDREVRISFAEKASNTSSSGPVLETRHVTPVGSTHNVFNYPLSIAAWALIEGRIIAWPDDFNSHCNFGLIDQLGKWEVVSQGVESPVMEAAPEIARYVNLEAVREGVRQRKLTLGEFFQDWASSQPNPRYDQFLSVPVPIIESFGNREKLPEHGVFNIDTRGGLPLLNVHTAELLKLASSLAVVVYRRFD